MGEINGFDAQLFPGPSGLRFFTKVSGAACLAAAGALDGRLGLPRSRRGARNGCSSQPGAAVALEMAARSRLGTAGTLELAARVRLGAAVAL